MNDEGLTLEMSALDLYGDQFTLPTQLTILNYPVILSRRHSTTVSLENLRVLLSIFNVRVLISICFLVIHFQYLHSFPVAIHSDSGTHSSLLE